MMKKRLFTTLLIFFVLLVGVSLSLAAAPDFQTNLDRFRNVQVSNNLTVNSGDLKVGSCTPDTTLNGSDAVICGTLEVDGAVNFDGAIDFAGGVDLNGQTLTFDSDGDTTGAASADDVITITLGAATGGVDIATGNLTVGDGVEDTTLNGEDAYIEGTLEVDGAVNLDGAVDIDGNLTSATGAFTVADTLNTTGAVTFDSTFDVDGNVSSGTGAFTVSDTINVTGNATLDADLIVDDTFNIDDTTYSSVGAQTLDPTASMYLLSPATTLTLTLATTTSVAGDIVWFVSTVATDTVIVDTTATAGGGNRTLGTAGDVIGFIYNGSVWSEAFFSDNS
jgi:cytoskeletal protein CcmA (bactofilin family)